jgi:hypothetical protein
LALTVIKGRHGCSESEGRYHLHVVDNQRNGRHTQKDIGKRRKVIKIAPDAGTLLFCAATDTVP